MTDHDDNGWATPQLQYLTVQRPRISGTALLGGLHLATGNYGTAPWWQLFLSGFGIVGSLAAALILTYLELATIDQFAGTAFALGLLGVTTPSAEGWQTYLDLALQLLPMLNFLVVLRLTPLSGYHAAEHKVVAAVEAYGRIEYDEVVEMPRAHPRCGTVLLFGILPTLLIAYPLAFTNPLAALPIAFVGWVLRYRVGYFIQQYFTTKPPTPGQLKAGIEAGRKLMALWSADPERRVSIARNLWTRGMPQMIGGVLVGQQLLGYLYSHAHLWLDF